MRSVEIVLFLVVLATVVATFARRISVPAPSLLVVAGIAVALFPGVPDIEVTPEVVSLVVLPPLLYGQTHVADVLGERPDQPQPTPSGR